ncbi:MAG: isoprenylcysteine carboxylmethyltransferase family protein [Saprospiraceae bacterium]
MKLKSIALHLRDILLLPGVVTILIPCLIFRYTPEVIPDFIPIKVFAFVVFISGLTLFSWTVSLFQRIAKGTLAPWTDKNKLVIEGPYRYCRNPMITGVLFMLLGEALWLRSLPILTWAFIFFIINTFYFILQEEPFLERKFGDDYRMYKRKVPRWLPSWQ